MDFCILGPLEVLDRGRPLGLGGRKQRALLALLLLHAGEAVSTERLVDELWGERPPATAAKLVQGYVAALRKLLPEGLLVTRAPGYLLGLDGAAHSLDLRRFEALVAAAKDAPPERAVGLFREALALWRGPALGDVWFGGLAASEAAALDGSRLVVLTRRIELELALGRHGDLVGELEGLVAAHPFQERLRAQLILALYRSGRQAEALEAYRQARRALDELGIEPSENLRRLETAILTHDPALGTPLRLVGRTIVLPGPLRVGAPFPFVGRARELDALRSILRPVEQGEGGRVVLIGGEAGSGKTRLVRELAHEAAENGALVLYGTSDADVNIPYQPFVESLECLVRVSDPEALKDCLGTGAGELTRLLPDLALQVGPLPAPLTGDPETQRHRLHTAVGELLARASRFSPLLVVVDDIHWADAASLQLLRQLARTAPGARMLLLATFRDKGEDMRPEFSDALADLARTDAVIGLGLGGLSNEDVAEFVQRSAGVDAPGELAHTLGELTDGIPFLLCELWRTLVEADAVDLSGGSVRLTRPVAELGTPEGVRRVVQHRLSRLPAETTAMLEVAAVAGAQFELSVLDEAVAFDKSTLASAIENAVGSGMIEEVPEPKLAHRFTHELVRRAIYDQLTGIRRAELHLRVGEALEHVHSDNPARVLAELAHHFTLASPQSDVQVERAVEYNRSAAKAAMVSLAREEAITRLSTALELVNNQHSPTLLETGRELKIQLARVLERADELERMEKLLEEVVQEAAAAGDRRLEFHALLERTQLRLNLDPNTVDLAQMRQQAETAVAVFDEFADESGLARAWSAIAFCHFVANQYDEDRVALERAIAHSRRADDDAAHTELALRYILSLLRGPTDVDEGIRRSQELIDETRADRLLQGAHELAQAAFAAMGERFVEAREHLSRGRVIFDELWPEGSLPNEIGGSVALWAGDPMEAERELRGLYASLEHLGLKSVLSTVAAELGHAVYLQGRFDEAELLSLTSEEFGGPDDVTNEMLWRQLRAKTLAQRGEFAAAEALARQAVQLGATTDALNWRGDSLMDLGEVLQLAGRPAHAATAIGEALHLYEQKGNQASARRARERLNEFALA